MINVARKNLFHEKTRFFISVSGIAAAVILIFILEGFAGGMFEQLTAFASNSEADIFVLQQGADNSQFGGSFLPKITQEEIRNITGVKKASGIFLVSAMLVKDSRKTPIKIVGYQLKEKFGQPWLLDAGRRPRSGKAEIVIDLALARRNKMELNDRIELLGQRFKIVGLSRETASWMNPYVFMSRENAAQLLKAPEAISLVLVKAKKGVNLKKLRDQIRKEIPGTNPVVTEELMAKETNLLRELMSSPLNLLVGIAYTIGTLVVGLTTYTAVIEKLREFGILKAVGAGRRRLFSIVISQSLTNVLVGFVVAAILANFVFWLIETIFPQFLLVIDLNTLLRTFVLVVFMSLIAAIIPIRRVSKIDPVEVFSR